MIAVGVVLCYLHRLELLQTCLLCYLVVAIVGIVLQMAHVGDVSDVAHLIALMLEVAEQDVEGYCRACMAQMRIAIHCRPHTYMPTLGLWIGTKSSLRRLRVLYIKNFCSIFYCLKLNMSLTE